MAKRAPDVKAVPMLLNESLYVGIDIGKTKHVARFLSKTLLERHTRFEACPALVFENSREGFRLLVERVRGYTPLEHVFVLIERTGHYYRALEQYLQELDIPVYVMPVQSRLGGMHKTGKRDALSLANQLYSQLELGVQVSHKVQLVRRMAPPTEAAAQLERADPPSLRTDPREHAAQEQTHRDLRRTLSRTDARPQRPLCIRGAGDPRALQHASSLGDGQFCHLATVARRGTCPRLSRSSSSCNVWLRKALASKGRHANVGWCSNKAS